MANLKDFATGTVAAAPSPATSGTSVTLQTGEAARMPEVPFYATAHPDYQLPTLDNAEKILVTAKNTTTNVLTIVRAQGDTTAKTIATGWRISNAVFKDDLFSQSLVTGETPSGSINGSNTAFTIAGAFTPNSLRVFLNGQRLKPGSGNDYQEGVNLTSFTMEYAPATNDVLLVDYNVGSSVLGAGVNVFINQETPTGLVNGSNASYTTARAYVSGTLQVYVNGLLQAPTTHVTEVSASAGTFTVDTAPATGDIVRVSYQYALSTGGNASALNGVAGSDYGDVNGQLFADYLGWRKFSQTLTYVSASTFTIPGDYSTILAKGTKLWLTQTTSKYFYVTGTSFSAGVTTVTVNAGTDYTLASATITAPYFSYEATPAGFPQYFTYAGVWAATATQPVLNNGTRVSRFTINQRTVIVHFNLTFGSTTTYGTSEYTFSLPMATANTGLRYHGSAWALDAGTAYYSGIAKAEANASTAQIYSSASSGNAWGQATPFTWGNGDTLNFTIQYEI